MDWFSNFKISTIHKVFFAGVLNMCQKQSKLNNIDYEVVRCKKKTLWLRIWFNKDEEPKIVKVTVSEVDEDDAYDDTIIITKNERVSIN